MFGKKKITKPVYPSDVAPNHKVNHYKETHSQSMMNYEIIPPVMSSSAISLQRVVGWWVTLLSTNPQIDLVKNR